MAEIKTKPSQVSVADFIASLENPVRRDDCQKVVELMRSVSGEEPVLWGSNIIGFGKYSYKYASGHGGETMKIGLSPRKEHLVLYGVIFYDQNTQLLSELGKHKQGKGCLYIKKLGDIDLTVLETMIRTGYNQPPIGVADNSIA